MTRKKNGKAPQASASREPWTPWGKWAKRRRERIATRKREREERRATRQRARMLRRMRRRRFLARGGVFILLFVFACMVGLLVFVLIGQPYPWQSLHDMTTVLRITRELEANQARWASLSIEHYTVEVEYRAGEVWCGPVALEVKAGAVVNTPAPSDTHWYPTSDCDQALQIMLITGAFEQLAAEIKRFTPGDSYLNATFDPDFGYITFIEAGVYADDDQSPDCCWQAAWQSLRPIN